jgi:hypothetical protein
MKNTLKKEYTLNLVINGVYIPLMAGSLKQIDIITMGYENKDKFWELVRSKYLLKSLYYREPAKVKYDFVMTYNLNGPRETGVLYAEDRGISSVKPDDIKKEFLLFSHDKDFVSQFVSYYNSYAESNKMAKALTDKILTQLKHGVNYESSLEEFINLMLHGGGHYALSDDSKYKGLRDIYLAIKNYRIDNFLMGDDDDRLNRNFIDGAKGIREEIMDEMLVLNREQLFNIPDNKEIMSDKENISIEKSRISYIEDLINMGPEGRDTLFSVTTREELDQLFPGWNNPDKKKEK